MKEFTTAVEDVQFEDEREAKITALMEQGKSREDAEDEVDNGRYVPFMLDGREFRAYPPTDGQLVLMVASMGRGQTNDQKFAAMVNIMLESLREDDAVYLEGRLLTRDRDKRLPIKKVEEIFEYLAEEWFARPTP